MVEVESYRFLLFVRGVGCFLEVGKGLGVGAEGFCGWGCVGG